MQRTPQFVTGPFKPHHKFLEDAEYGRALDSIVKAVSDVLVISEDRSRVFLGRRNVEPQPDWWYIGGRAKPGETPQQAASRNARREIALDIPPERFEVLANYSFVWHMRQQAPADHGTADTSTIHTLTLMPEEEPLIKLDKAEYSDARWFRTEDILAGEFHPALKQSVHDLHAKEAYMALQTAVDGGSNDSTIAQLAKELLKKVESGNTVPVQGVTVNFDSKTSTYKVQGGIKRKRTTSLCGEVQVQS
eukprot:TRINITY_DN93470_c0_g1_i1.p1 TRINITY_DN93470_c0_g1~~TRINITY_DN93470_c0_g1_i1.p1  ORF type:complete len:248 (-),score=48.45 TRINITY_DN93470_c0_g1_i1:52-795(-)